jgi:hypothetical protein
MKVKFRVLFFCPVLIAYCLLFPSCKKDKPVYSEVPEITFVSVSSTNVNDSDPLTFVISYQDGDGDLGENTDGVHNLFLSDNRFATPYQYRVKELAPHSSVIIKGTLSIELISAKLTGAGPENAVFSIYVVDRAGHKSNTVISPAVTVHQ